jgi:2-octaprenyl-6-methoxyphenol hydroxylase
VQVINITEHAHDQHACISLQDGRSFTANVVIQAEGGTFADQEQRAQHHDYQQTAVIAHVQVERAIAHRAFERFSEQGPIALLPEGDGYSLVWCLQPTQATSMLDLNDQEFLAALQLAFGDRLGRFLKVSPRFSFPLGLNAQAQASQHIVRIGNAAQTLHPVAGQGLNLGLRDAFVLAQCLSRNADTLASGALTKFLELRKTDRQATIQLTDTMAKIFTRGQDGSFIQGLLGMSLCAVDLLPSLKKVLAEQMMFGWR